MTAETIARLAEQTIAALPAFASGLVVIAVFWAMAAVVRAGLRRLAQDKGSDRAILVNLAARAFYWALVLVGLVSGLGTMGIDVSALVAGLGLTGFALGVACKDLLSNLLAGGLILLYRPFRYGDRVEVAGYKGIVVDIDLRYTTVEGDGARYLIPNQTLYTKPITIEVPPGEKKKAPAQAETDK